MPPKGKKIIHKKKKKAIKLPTLPNHLRKSPIPSKILRAQSSTKQIQMINSRNVFNNATGDVTVQSFVKKPNYVVPKSFVPKLANHSDTHANGLSPKDISYIIGHCQARRFRYAYLKDLAHCAMRHKKIFSIYGNCTPVRRALMERGWVEKIPQKYLNLSKLRSGSLKTPNEVNAELEKLLLSTIVNKTVPRLVWYTDNHWSASNNLDLDAGNVLMNKLRTEAIFTSKQGLCLALKQSHWFYIEDVAEVNNPRTYHSSNEDDLQSFVEDYKLSACTSLLKYTINMTSINEPIFQEDGTISMNVFIFAINRCKEFLFQTQNKDIDRPLKPVNQKQWNVFLKNYYRVVSKGDVFGPDKNNRLQLYLVYAKFLLKEIHRHRPQLDCEGFQNIWIIKPTHFSRGRGIRMASKLAVIMSLLNKSNQRYVIQKYIEDPLLIYNTKFDIRQYYLVTKTYPLEIWMYRDCYLKFSSQNYTLTSYHASIHLTNYAIQRHFKNAPDRHPELPKNNMWDLKQYKLYLTKLGKMKVWDNIIYPGMRKNIIAIMLSCQESLPACKNRFELYGCDFILDKDYNPWIIEVNSCPDLKSTTSVTGTICPAVIKDIIKVVIDRGANPKASTGKFECIYRQPLTTPKYGITMDLQVKGYALPNSYFYKGRIDVMDRKELEIKQERHVNEMLGKMKEYCKAQDLLDVRSESDISAEVETCVHTTKSECELSVTASIINEQIDGLLDKVSTGYWNSCNLMNSFVPSTFHKDRVLVVSKRSSFDSLASRLSRPQRITSVQTLPLPVEDIIPDC